MLGLASCDPYFSGSEPRLKLGIFLSEPVIVQSLIISVLLSLLFVRGRGWSGRAAHTSSQGRKDSAVRQVVS